MNMRNVKTRLWSIFLLMFTLYTGTNGDTTFTTDIITITSSDLTMQTTIMSNSSSIYIIGSFSYSGTTMETSQITSMSTTPSMTTNTIGNGIYIITNYTIFQSTTTTTMAPPAFCVNSTHYKLSNGTCVSNTDAQLYAANTLRSNTSNDTQKGDALGTYITSSTNLNTSSNSTNTFTIGDINGILSSLSTFNYTSPKNNDTVLILTQPNGNLTNKTTIGASFSPAVGGETIDTLNRDNITDSKLLVAGILTLESLEHVQSFNMFLVNNPSLFRNSDNSSNATLVSSIVFATTTGNTTAISKITVELFFQTIIGIQQPNGGTYMCAFYDISISQWNTSGCGIPQYNPIFNRYECTCNHLTSFALIWLPQPLNNNFRAELTAQDKASVAFQIISILCFAGIIIHGVYIRITSPEKLNEPKNLVPLVSCAVTMILFILYITLGYTVFDRYKNMNSSDMQNPPGGNQNGGRFRRDVSLPTNPSSSQCLSSEQGLMFTVYFFIILMFCLKTGIGYYAYRRYVLFFPDPTYIHLIITGTLSVIIALIWLAFAAGFNSNPNNAIAQIYLGKLCWFNRSVIHYFLTIPIAIFLAVNIWMCVSVFRKNKFFINDTPDEKEKRKRRRECIIVLLASCATQGFGWLTGPFISVVDPITGEVLGWIFIIFNGLEGLWTIILYVIVLSEKMDRNIRNQGDSYRDIDMGGNYELPEETGDRQALPLRNLRSDSPRNSFTDLGIHRRSGHADNDDN